MTISFKEYLDKRKEIESLFLSKEEIYNMHNYIDIDNSKNIENDKFITETVSNIFRFLEKRKESLKNTKNEK